MLRTFLFLLFVVLSLCHVWCEVIRIEQGFLRGVDNVSRGGRKYHSFLGIPFAKPPVGNLRFQSPQPHPGWDGILNATEDGSVCVQDEAMEATQDEDCLFINVHTHGVPPKRKCPVLVYFHGGSFLKGNGGTKSFGVGYLMDRDIVYVSINYRLGILGFLSFENIHMPGNYGLKDQLLALKWIKENIRYFGGDPNSITIFGQSAGAASVHYQLLSPKSQGLFHRAIMHSGSAFCPWAMTPQGIAKSRAKSVAILLGCFGNPTKVVSCLRKIAPQKFLRAQSKFIEWFCYPYINFAPVIEVPHADAFITKYPLYYKTNPNIPIIAGVTKHEGVIVTAGLCSDDYLRLNQLNQNWENFVPISTNIIDSINVVNPMNAPSVSSALKSFYLKNESATSHNFESLTDMYSDLYITFGTIKAAEHASGPVYFYLYGFENEVLKSKNQEFCSSYLGVNHGDELINIFAYPNVHLGGKYLDMSHVLVETWTNFAIKGVPKDDKNVITSWTEFKRKNSSDYLYIGDLYFTMASHIFEDRVKFIETLPLQFNHLSSSGVTRKFLWGGFWSDMYLIFFFFTKALVY